MNKGRPTRDEQELRDAWEEATTALHTSQEFLGVLCEFLRTLEANAKKDYDQEKPISQSRVEQVEFARKLSDSATGKVVLALDAIRGQRSRLFRGGREYEGGDG